MLSLPQWPIVTYKRMAWPPYGCGLVLYIQHLPKKGKKKLVLGAERRTSRTNSPRNYRVAMTITKSTRIYEVDTRFSNGKSVYPTYPWISLKFSAGCAEDRHPGAEYWISRSSLILNEGMVWSVSIPITIILSLAIDACNASKLNWQIIKTNPWSVFCLRMHHRTWHQCHWLQALWTNEFSNVLGAKLYIGDIHCAFHFVSDRNDGYSNDDIPLVVL